MTLADVLEMDDRKTDAVPMSAHSVQTRAEEGLELHRSALLLSRRERVAASLLAERTMADGSPINGEFALT